MRSRRSLLGLPALLLLVLPVLAAQARHEGIPVGILGLDEPPVKVMLFFSPGGPLERFTSRQDAWYALYSLSLVPGQPCTVILRHNGEPERIRVFALDGNPFEGASVKYELPMAEADRRQPPAHTLRTYEAVISLPLDSAVAGVYLLLEWTPKAPDDKPQAILVQALSTGTASTRGRRAGTDYWMVGPDEPFKSRRPIILPVPRRQWPAATF